MRDDDWKKNNIVLGLRNHFPPLVKGELKGDFEVAKG